MYYSAINSYSFVNSHPLVIKDYSLTATPSGNNNTEYDLVFPMPECFYVDLTNAEITFLLPDVNTYVGGVDPKTQICRYKFRQMLTGPNNYWHLKSQNATIYDYLNGSKGNFYTPGAWFLELHLYNGNWYCNSIN